MTIGDNLLYRDLPVTTPAINGIFRLLPGFQIFNALTCALLALLLVLAQSTNAMAAAQWTISSLDPSSLAKDIVPDNRAMAINGLPDGRIAENSKSADIRQAWYSAPTKRYKHGVLGDRIEGGSLVAITASGVKLKYRLPESEVFEDITPRLADLDGDGKFEIITITSSVFAGAAISIFQLNGNALVRRAHSQYIGRPNRWLNIAGINHYLGGSTPEIALVITPHIGGRLDLFKFSRGRLVRIASASGFSNHVLGAREQRLSADYLAPGGKKVNLALPSADRQTLRIMTIGAKGWSEIANVPLPAAIDKAILAKGSGDKVKFTVGLANGSVYLISPK